uniref:RRM domain-containing protein n=1 Tax=Oryza meridionalis TaxID=40149 RepID=A0A0E0CHH0_9ORYZ
MSAAVNEETSVYVGGLPYEANEDMLRDAFGRFGTIVSVKVINDQRVRGKCYGFVTFTHADAAQHAISGMDGKCVLEVPENSGVKVFGENLEAQGMLIGTEGIEKGAMTVTEIPTMTGIVIDLVTVIETDFTNLEALIKKLTIPWIKIMGMKGVETTTVQQKCIMLIRIMTEKKKTLKTMIVKERKKRSSDQEKGSAVQKIMIAGIYQFPVMIFTAKRQLNKAIQMREDLENEVSQIKDKVAAKEQHIADLQKRSQKLEDELSAARKVSSERQLVVTKLYKCFLQLQDYNDRVKMSEKELQSLIDDAMGEVDIGEDATTKDGSMYENGVA